MSGLLEFLLTLGSLKFLFGPSKEDLRAQLKANEDTVRRLEEGIETLVRLREELMEWAERCDQCVDSTGKISEDKISGFKLELDDIRDRVSSIWFAPTKEFKGPIQAKTSLLETIEKLEKMFFVANNDVGEANA